MKSFVKGMAAAVVAVTTAVSALSADAATLNMGILATESTDNLMKRYGGIIEAMKRHTGLDVKPYFASDYAGIIEAMRFDKVDVVVYGNKSAMEAVERAGAEVFAQETELSGSPGYYSILVTNKKNTDINSLDDVLKCDKSLNFGIGDPNSTSGFLVPTTFIFAANKVLPRDCFKTVRNASHETNLMSVATNQVDVATANNIALYSRLQRNAPKMVEKIKEIWRSPLIASDPVAWRKKLPEDVKLKVYKFFMSYGRLGTPEEVKAARAVLAKADMRPFTPSSNAQLYPFYQMEATKQIQKIEADDKLSAAEKKTRTAALYERIETYRKLIEDVPQM